MYKQHSSAIKREAQKHQKLAQVQNFIANENEGNIDNVKDDDDNASNNGDDIGEYTDSSDRELFSCIDKPRKRQEATSTQVAVATVA